MYCHIKLLFDELLNSFDNDLETNTWDLEHNAENLQEILNSKEL